MHGRSSSFPEDFFGDRVTTHTQNICHVPLRRHTDSELFVICIWVVYALHRSIQALWLLCFHLPNAYFHIFRSIQIFRRCWSSWEWFQNIPGTLLACAMWLREARSRGSTTSWVAVAAYVRSFKRFKVSRTSSLVPYPKKPSESWPKSCHDVSIPERFCHFLSLAPEGWISIQWRILTLFSRWSKLHLWLSVVADRMTIPRPDLFNSWALHVYSLHSESLSYSQIDCRLFVLWLKFHWRLVCRHTHPECAERQV